MKILTCIFSLLILVSCNNDVIDYSGFVHSDETVQDRFLESQQLNPGLQHGNILVADSILRIVFAGDLHIGGTENLKKVLEQAKNLGADIIFYCGDNTSGKAEKYDSLMHYVNKYPNIAHKFVLGNHDAYFGGWQSFKKHHGGSVYSFFVNYDNRINQIIILDSGNGVIGVDQMEWLKGKLGEFGSKTIIATHNNLIRHRYTTSTTLRMEELNVLYSLFGKYSVPLVVSGHDHKRNVDRLGKTDIITLDVLRDNEPNASFLYTEVHKDTIINQFIEL